MYLDMLLLLCCGYVVVVLLICCCQQLKVVVVVVAQLVDWLLSTLEARSSNPEIGKKLY